MVKNNFKFVLFFLTLFFNSLNSVYFVNTSTVPVKIRKIVYKNKLVIPNLRRELIGRWTIERCGYFNEAGIEAILVLMGGKIFEYKNLKDNTMISFNGDSTLIDR